MNAKFVKASAAKPHELRIQHTSAKYFQRPAAGFLAEHQHRERRITNAPAPNANTPPSPAAGRITPIT